MQDHALFWRLEALSDRQLLERLGSALGSSRRLMAQLIAHLGEVEKRRLHLAAACSSMFAYCLKLGMTEDEAYRRIEVARLARRYPAIFPLLANGQLSLSVVALLKHHLSEENHQDLLASVAGKSVAQARELIATRFPRPDVPSSVRKLPERRTMTASSLALSTPPESSASGRAPSTGVTEPRFPANVTEPRAGETEPRAGETEPRAGETEPRAGETEPRFASNVTRSTEVSARAVTADVARKEGSMSFAPAVDATRATAPEKPPPADSQRVAPMPPPTDSRRAAAPPPPSRIEPLSAQRYKVQFTGSAELARKLELARDLMRHCHPEGELGPIVERGLDLLIESLMQRRFGKKARPQRTSTSTSTSTSSRNTDPERRSDVMSDSSTMRAAAEPSTTLADVPSHPTPTRDTVEPATSTTPESVMPKSVMPESAPSAVVTPAVVTPESPPETADLRVDRPGGAARATVSSYIPRSTRRAVVERDGLGCSWVDERGVRCGSQAWLEYDHRHPRAKGGGSEPDNVRLLCRSHNRFAAERAYGRTHVERTISERQRDEPRM